MLPFFFRWFLHTKGILLRQIAVRDNDQRIRAIVSPEYHNAIIAQVAFSPVKHARKHYNYKLVTVVGVVIGHLKAYLDFAFYLAVANAFIPVIQVLLKTESGE